MSSMISVTGHVDTHLIAPDGRVVPGSSGRNTTLYTCTDAVARLFAGDVRARPAAIVVAYTTDGTGTFNYTANDRTRKTVEDIAVGLSFDEVDITGSGKLSSTDASKYAGNVVRLSGVTGAAFNAVDMRNTAARICGYILKAVDGTVLAVRGLSPWGEKGANYAMFVSWTLTFN